MIWLERPARRRRREIQPRSFFVALAAILAVSGCSSVPDYANPVEWYNSTVDLFDDDAPPPLTAEEVPGANEPFPELSETPEAPLREIELGSLETIGEGLAADRANAQYTDEVIRSSDEAALAEPPTYQAEPPTYQAEPPTYQAELPSYQQPVTPTLPTLEVPPLPQPSAAVPVPPLQPATQQPAFQPAPAPAPTQTAYLQPVAVDRGVDVRTMFANLFTSSGPRAVAPPAGGTLIAMAPAASSSSSAISTPLPSSSSLISQGGGLVSGTALQAGASQAAVIYFALGSSRISKQGRDALRKLADYHKQSGGTLRVVGHASNRTKELSAASHELVNFNISFKRARAVADELIRRGVSPDKVEVIAMSDNAPVYREWMPSGEAGNRRAEVYIDF